MKKERKQTLGEEIANALDSWRRVGVGRGGLGDIGGVGLPVRQCLACGWFCGLRCYFSVALSCFYFVPLFSLRGR